MFKYVLIIRTAGHTVQLLDVLCVESAVYIHLHRTILTLQKYEQFDADHKAMT